MNLPQDHMPLQQCIDILEYNIGDKEDIPTEWKTGVHICQAIRIAVEILKGENSYIRLFEPNNENVIYVQWYFYKRKSGYKITDPTKEQLEDFYETIAASDPYHESFVLVVRKENINDMRFIDDYIINNVLPRLFSGLYR